ncbi:MAG: NAD(P)H-quinone oxidoreductase subunit F, partial [Cyanobacteria bacterium P01_G01_bin.4]
MEHLWVQTSWLLPLYGLLGAIATIPWAAGMVRSSGPRTGAYINLVLSVLACIHGAAVLRSVWGTDGFEIIVPWLQVVNLDLSFSLRISPISVAAAELATWLSLMAQLYALGYMEKDWGMARFFSILGFFEAAMVGMALSNSMLLSYCLLELLTLSTYMLVGFWYAQPLARTAARDAFWTKRVGDLLLLMGVVTLSSFTGSLNFSDLTIWVQTVQLSPTVSTLLGLVLIAGPIGTCAQFPLNLWLDEAMEGPNPASIMRNSIVVTTGAYILIQLQPVLTIAPIAANVLVAIGAATAIGASLVSIAQVDFKRVLSHSTSAYLGLVFIAVGLNSTDAALMLLFTHAVAKALLFMSCGSVIFTTHTQDLRELGGLGGRMPSTSTAFLLGTAAIVGLFPLGCFWGMVHWIEVIGLLHPAMPAIVVAVNGLTAFSLMRAYSLVFKGDAKPKTRRSPEVIWPMGLAQVTVSIVVLAAPFMLLKVIIFSDLELLPWPWVAAMMAASAAGAIAALGIYSGGWISTPVVLPTPALQNLLSFD